jgi:PucR-like helix-turn-helix protein/GAF domain-containing protein
MKHPAIAAEIYASSMSAFSADAWEAALLGADPVGVDEIIDALPVSERGTVELSVVELRASTRRIAGQLTALRTRVARQLEVRGVTDAITGVREPEPIMDRLVIEARRLLSADLAYIATGDSDVRFTIQHCDGVTLTNLVGTSFAPRTGLAAEAVRTGRPMQVQDYASSSLFTHGEADEIARAEGMVSVLAIPLVLRARLGGVLCVAHRTATEFSPADIELGKVIADHAASCVETAALLVQHADRIERLTELNHQLTERDRLLSDEARWTADVIGIVGGGGDVQEILAAMASERHDVAFIPAAGGPPLRSGPQVLTGLDLDALSAAPELDDLEIAGSHCHRRPVAAGGQRFGTLVLAHREPISAEDEALLGRAAPVLALILAAQASAENEIWRDRGAWLRAALTGPDGAPDPGKLPGIHPNRNYVVLYCAMQPSRGGSGDQPAVTPARVASALPAGTSFPDSDDLVVICAPADLDRTVQALRKTLGRKPFAIGVSAEARGRIRELRGALREARQVATGLLTLQMQQTVADSSALGPLTLLLAAAGDTDARLQAEEALRPLAMLPARRGTELRDTMAAFLRHNQHMQRTAQELHIHVNTLYQRLDSITEVFGDTWRTPQHSLALRLALEISDLAARAPRLTAR